jgi:hypothetical protein
MGDDVIELDVVVRYVLATDVADLAIAPNDLQHHIARHRTANAPILSSLGERFRRKEYRADVAKDATPQFVSAILGDPRPPAGLQTQYSLDCSVYLRIILKIPHTNRVHQFCVAFPHRPYRELVRYKGEELNKAGRRDST